MGLAVASFETTSGALPVGFGRPVSSRNAILNSQHSFFVDILPQLEFQATYDKIMSQHDGFYFVDILYPELAKGFGDYFRCPSEVEDTACNYRGNGGTSMYPFSMEVFGLNEGGNGAFKERESLRSSDFADGLSNTALLSEKSSGTRDRVFNRRDEIWYSGLFYILDRFPASDELLAILPDCPDQPFIFAEAVGRSPLVGGYYHTLYNHLLPPITGDFPMLTTIHPLSRWMNVTTICCEVCSVE